MTFRLQTPVRSGSGFPFLFLGALAILAGSTTRGEDGEGTAHTITVLGTGKASVAPDIAEVNVGVVTQGKTAQEALTGNAEAMTALHALLKERGVAPKDVQTNQFQIAPQYGD